MMSIGNDAAGDAHHSDRSAARLAATQALYQIEITKGDAEEVIQEFIDHRFGTDVESGNQGAHDEAFFRDVVIGVLNKQVEVDRLLARSLAEGWTLGRIDSILRALLRAAAYELVGRADVPVNVVINEYVELAKDFFDGDEPSFVNAVLDRISRDRRGGPHDA
jgi:N utilization substance protein B